MAERADQDLTLAVIKSYIVATGQTITQYSGVKINASSDNEVDAVAAITDNGYGIALDAGAAGARIRVALFGSGIVPIKLGTGGATRGLPAKFVAGGATNATVGGVTTKLCVYGLFTQTGVAGDIVGLNLGMASLTVGS